MVSFAGGNERFWRLSLAPTNPLKAIDSAPERNWRLGRTRRADPMRVPRSTRSAAVGFTGAALK
jgi:hypothetical protein